SRQPVEQAAVECVKSREGAPHEDLLYSAAAGAIAATSARSPGRTDLGSNFRTLAAILVKASAIDIGGAASFLRDGGTNRTGLMRATTTARRYGLFIPMACIVFTWAATRSSISMMRTAHCSRWRSAAGSVLSRKRSTLFSTG